MGTHPIFESNFDCLTDFATWDTKTSLRAQGQKHQRKRIPPMPDHWLPIGTHPQIWTQRVPPSIPRNRPNGRIPEARLSRPRAPKTPLRLCSAVTHSFNEYI